MPAKVSRAITKAPADSTNGSDQVGKTLMRSLQQAQPATLSTVFTQVLRTAIHPDTWKSAIVVPIPKANKRTYDHPKSWRCLHLLSVVSKTLERVVLERLQDQGEDLGTLGDDQFGSRRDTGTSDAMMAIEDWKAHASLTGPYAIILADVEGGFDKVNPDRLGDTNLAQEYIPWIQNWCRNRSIVTRIDGRTDTSTYILNQGIAQGSPLSPYLFGAYI